MPKPKESNYHKLRGIWTAEGRLEGYREKQRNDLRVLLDLIKEATANGQNATVAHWLAAAAIRIL